MKASQIKLFFICVITALLIVLPIIITNLYFIHVMIMILMNIIMAEGVYLILKVGQVSLGQAAFMAIGAYISTILVMKAGLSFWLTLPMSGIASGIVGAILGYPALRLRGVYFVIVTFCFGEGVVLGIRYSTFLGGNNGIMGIPQPNPISIGGLINIEFISKVQYYYLILVLTIVTLLVIWGLHRFHLGRAFAAVGENARLAEAVGINLFRYKMTAFIIACFFTGLAGGIFAPYFTYIHPTFFGVFESFFALLYVLVGGPAYFLGPIVGTTVLVTLNETLTATSKVTGAQELIYGIVLILVITFLPKGLMSFAGTFSKY